MVQLWNTIASVSIYNTIKVKQGGKEGREYKVMLKIIIIKKFRLFRDLTLKSLNRVNLIAGENNSGKTALLEALCLLFGDLNSIYDFPSALRKSFKKEGSSNHLSFSADEFDNFWTWLFYKKRLISPITIEVLDSQRLVYKVVTDTSTNEVVFRYFLGDKELFSYTVSKGNGISGGKPSNIEWSELIFFSTNLSSPTEDADHFNRIAAKRGGRKKLIELLQVIEPRLQDLQYLKLGQQPLVYADLGMEDLIPTTQLGQGFGRLLRLFSEILYSQSKIVLIDEIENGIHYSAMSKVWTGIATIARQEDLQIFATTHSYECIRSAHEAFSSEPTYDLALHRFERIDDEIKVATYTQETLETSIEMNLEVR